MDSPIEDLCPDCFANQTNLDPTCLWIGPLQVTNFLKLFLKSKAKLDPTMVDLCPECVNSSHNICHLFSYLANQTNLDPTSLWTDGSLVDCN